MPIHNWGAVNDGMFHWFHQLWIVALADWLNGGRLPDGYYAIGELYADEVYPDVLAVEDRPMENGKQLFPGGGVAVAEQPPKTRFAWEAETEGYLAKKNLLAIRNVEGILVAIIEIVSRGNKSSRSRFGKFLDKTTGFLEQGVHVLVIDLFPQTPRDPQGIHQAIWSELYEGEFEFCADKPLTLASYMAASEDTIARAYVEPIAVGDVLPEMPLFLWPERYVNLNLETPYASAWAAYPAPLKPKVERAESA